MSGLPAIAVAALGFTPWNASQRPHGEAVLASIAVLFVALAFCAALLLVTAAVMLRRPAQAGVPSSHRVIGAAISAAPALYLVGVIGVASLDLHRDVGVAPPLAILGLLGLLAWNWWQAGRERGLPWDPTWIASYSLFLTGCSAFWILGDLLKAAPR
ncbi:MAG: hypothetical protein GC161_08220 [Planctomycetaceae bacterium]|nr:hypothetical protein [Planctomycetaceae bacterium]